MLSKTKPGKAQTAGTVTKRNEVKRIYHVQRPLGSGRSFKFFCSQRATITCGGAPTGSALIGPSSSTPALGWKNGGTVMDPQYNCTLYPCQMDGAGLLQLLFENEPITFAGALLKNCKSPDLFKYLTAVPVYYGIRCTIERAYIELNTGGSSGHTTSDIQFAQNLAEGQAFDFYFYWDSQNYNSVVEFSGDAAQFSQMLDIRKFKHSKHRPSDGPKCSIAGDMSLPKVFSAPSTMPYLKPTSPTEGLGATLRTYFSSVVSDTTQVLGPPGALYIAPVMPLCSTQFNTLFNAADNVNNARLLIDVRVTTKLILKASNYVGVVTPWTVGGGNKVPNDVS